MLGIARSKLPEALAALAALAMILACSPQGGVSGQATGDDASLGPPDAPEARELANATYHGIQDGPVQLRDGLWKGEPFEPGAAARPSVGLVRDFRRTGDLDGDGKGESVVLLWENSGGSGANTYVAVVGKREGAIANLGTALIGDRVQVRAARVAGNRIEMMLIRQGPDDDACCPSQNVTRTWSLGTEGLEDLGSEVTGTLSLQDLGGSEWVLTHFAWEEPAPKEPEITLLLEKDRFVGSAGCNRYFVIGTVGTMPGDLSLGEISATRMLCPPEITEFETRYLRQLQGNLKYSFLAGKLALTGIQGDTTTLMLFAARAPKGKG